MTRYSPFARAFHDLHGEPPPKPSREPVIEMEEEAPKVWAPRARPPVQTMIPLVRPRWLNVLVWAGLLGVAVMFSMAVGAVLLGMVAVFIAFVAGVVAP